MITFENVSKSFRGSLIIDNISGELKSGKINMIIGNSGAGKSVFLKCLLGIIPVDNGKIYFDNNEMVYGQESVDYDNFRRHIGILQQKPALFPEKTIEDNIMLYLDILTDMTHDQKIARVNSCLEQVGMSGCNNMYPNELSGGMRKKVGLALAIVNNPKYLFCDEPNSGLDPLSSKKIDHLIKTVSKKGKITTVIVSHNLDSIIEIGENILFVNNKKLGWNGPCSDIFKSGNKELDDFLKSSITFENYTKFCVKN